MLIFRRKVRDGTPGTRWSERNECFVINLPKSSAPSEASMFAAFHRELLGAFKGKDDTALPIRSSAPAEETWADVDPSDLDTASILTPATTERFHAPASLDRLPDVRNIERPEILLQKPPYYMIIYYDARSKMVVHCSHQPSLDLIAEYFKKWTRKNHNLYTKVSTLHIFVGMNPAELITAIATGSRHRVGAVFLGIRGSTRQVNHQIIGEVAAGSQSYPHTSFRRECSGLSHDIQ
jgi:hypothetical protein